MDYCVDCGRRLRDLFCRRCKMIYVIEVYDNMACRNCTYRMIQQGSKLRYRCDFCLHRYFAYGDYDPSHEHAIKEYIACLERDCPECNHRMTVNPQNKELVCNVCGLVYEEPIFTEI